MKQKTFDTWFENRCADVISETDMKIMEIVYRVRAYEINNKECNPRLDWLNNFLNEMSEIIDRWKIDSNRKEEAETIRDNKES